MDETLAALWYWVSAMMEKWNVERNWGVGREGKARQGDDNKTQNEIPGLPTASEDINQRQEATAPHSKRKESTGMDGILLHYLILFTPLHKPKPGQLSSACKARQAVEEGRREGRKVGSQPTCA